MASDAGNAFVEVLRAAQLPECLWDALLDKIEAGDINVHGAFEAQAGDNGSLGTVKAMRQLSPTADVFLLPHAVSATRPGLQRQLMADSKFHELIGSLLQLSPGHTRDDAFRSFFSWAKPSPTASGASFRALTVWHLLPAEGLWLRHAEAAPNMNVVPLPDFIVERIGPDSEAGPPPGASLVWPKTTIQASQALTRDWLPGNRSVQRAAVLLKLLQPLPSAAGQNAAAPDARWAVPAEHDGLLAAVAAAAAGQLPPGLGEAARAAAPSDKRPNEQPQGSAARKQPLRVHFQYPAARELLTHPAFEAVEEAEKADILFYASPVRYFLSIPTKQLISQFPYEGAIVRKDLLPATMRRLVEFNPDDRQQVAKDPRRWHPPVLPAMYDLATEPHFFLADFEQRAAAGRDNHWVVKQAQGTRTADACVTKDATTILAYRSAPGGDRVVQKYIERPVTWRGRKFDLRVYVAVRSIAPLDAYLFTGWYARVANKEFAMADDSLTDFETHFTVVCYEDDQQLAASQVAVSQAELAPELAAQGVDVAAVQDQLRMLARDVLTAAGTQIGSWPSSRAIYGLDVMLAAPPRQQDASSGAVPQLLEVNSAPDFSLVSKQFPGFLNDAFATLFLTDQPPPASFVQL